MPWKRLSTIVDDSRADALSELLSEHGAVSVTVEPANDDELLALYEPGPGETPMWRHARVTGLFEQQSAFAAIQAEGRDRLAIDADSWRSDTLDDQLWERAWMDDFKPIQVGPRLWVCPGWLEPPQADAVNILMDPGLAFGSGTHPTTLLCLEWLEQQLQPGLQLRMIRMILRSRRMRRQMRQPNHLAWRFEVKRTMARRL
jgi:ribosomal protein L11 methyltransferase